MDQCPPSLFNRLIRPLSGASTKRAVTVWATWTLASAVLGIGGCIAGRIVAKGDVGSGAVAAFLGAVTGLTTLAGVSYRKPEAPQ